MRKNSTTFLLIEDDPNDVIFAQQEFKNHQRYARIFVVSDGIEAVRYLEGASDYSDRNKCPIPDVILLDLKMPRFSGFDFLEWLRIKAPNQLHLIPVVVLSSSNLPEDILRAYALSANSYLVKPTTWTDYRRKLQTIITYWAEQVETPQPVQAGASSRSDTQRPAVRSNLVALGKWVDERL